MESKNVDITIEALRYVDDRFVLCVIGDGPARAALELLVDRLGLRPRVHFLGQVDDTTLYRWLRTATVYVSMSRQEAFGLTLAEALVARVPIVASAIPAHAEVVETAAGGEAVLVPLGTSPAVLAGVVRDTADRGQRAPPAPGVLSWDAVAARTIAVYQAVFEAERSR
jgi:glycosyltransferase involved in cell wall biosynthesis